MRPRIIKLEQSALANQPAAATGLIATPSKFLLGLPRFFSPYQLIPFDINPLRSLHLIETDEKVNQLEIEKSLDTSLPFLLRLKEEGRARANFWPAQNAPSLGRRLTLDVDRFAA